jgi:HEAT repeat protein
MVTIDLVMAQLTDLRSSVRERAARMLGELGDLRAERALETALREDPDADVRLAAAEALMELDRRGTPDRYRKFDALRANLKSSDPVVRKKSVDSLADFPGSWALDTLRIALEDPEPTVRQAAARTLGRLGASESGSDLRAALKDSDRRVRRAAAEALGALGLSESGSDLRAALKDSDPGVRRAAAEALGALGARRRLTAAEGAGDLASALKDPDPTVRREVARALRWFPTMESDSALRAALKDSDPLVRHAAAEGLGALGPTKRVRELRAALKDSDPRVRKAAARALERLGKDPHTTAKSVAKPVVSLLIVIPQLLFLVLWWVFRIGLFVFGLLIIFFFLQGLYFTITGKDSGERVTEPPTCGPTTLKNAIIEELVDATFEGTGTTSGPSIVAKIRNKTDRDLSIATSGTVLKSKDPLVQDMIVKRAQERVQGIWDWIEPLETGLVDCITLSPGEVATYILDAYCLNFNRATPHESDRFSVEGEPPAELKQLFSILGQVPAKQASEEAVQVAIWVITDNITLNELNARFPTAGPNDVENARALLDKAGIPSSI